MYQERQAMTTNQAIDYFEHKGISNSKLKDFERSPLHFYQKHVIKTTEEPDKDCYRIGRAAHCLALEHEKFSERFMVIPKINRKTNDGKAEYAGYLAKAAAAKADVVNEEEFKAFKKMAENILSKRMGRLIFEHAEFEREIYVKCPYTGLDRKIKPDISIAPNILDFLPFGLLADYKTTQDASDTAFNKSIWNLQYDYQDAYYTDTWCIHYGLNRDSEMPPFIFIPVEKTEPYECNFIDLDPVDRIITRDNRIYPLLDGIAKCYETDIWLGYEDSVKRATKPNYILR